MPDPKNQQITALVPPDQLKPSPDQPNMPPPILQHGYLVWRNTGTGTMIVTNLLDPSGQHHKTEGRAAIQCFTTCYPYVITVHENDSLQVLNVATNQCDLFAQEKGTTEGIRRVLANTSVIVGVAPKRMVVWELENMATKPPRVIDTSTAPMHIMSTSEMSTLVSNTRVVLMNTNPSGHLFQVWDLAAGKLVAYAENPSKIETFFSFGANADGTVVGTCRDCLYIWLTSGAPGLVEPFQTVKFDGCLLSSVAVDSHLILVGDNFGGITVHTKTGRYLYYLNRVKNDADPLDLQTTQLSQLSSAFRTKVNRLVRIGRWVFAACENSRIKVFDIFSPGLTAPCDVFTHPTANTSIRDLCVVGRRVFALAFLPPDSAKASSSKAAAAADAGKAKPAHMRYELVTWAPKLEGDSLAYTSANPELWEAEPARLVHQACSMTALTVAKMEPAFRPDEYRVHLQSLKNCESYLGTVVELQNTRGIELPFLLCQNVQAALDKYDAALAKMTKASRSSKSREALEDERVSLMHALDLALSCADFLGEIKSRTGALFSYSEKQTRVGRLDDAYGGSARSDERSARTATHSRSKASARGGAKGTGSENPSADEAKEDPIDDMLGEVIDDLGFMHEQATETLNNFDAACNAGVHDPDKITPLLSVYTKLRQLHEDLKETAKEIGEFRGDDASQEWWKGGGDYDEGGAAAAAAAAPSGAN